jgi:glutamyl-tRNA reductase
MPIKPSPQKTAGNTVIINRSLERALEIAARIYAIAVKVPNSNEIITKTTVLSDEQKMFANLFDF